MYIWNEGCIFASSVVIMFSISSEKGIPFTWNELLRQICSKGKQEWVLVGLLTFVFSNHPSVFQGFAGEALHSSPSVAALWLHWEERAHKDLKEAPSSDTWKTTLHTCALLFHQSPTACLLPHSVTSREREINCSKARKTGCVSTPNDIQAPSMPACCRQVISQPKRGGEVKHPN